MVLHIFVFWPTVLCLDPSLTTWAEVFKVRVPEEEEKGCDNTNPLSSCRLHHMTSTSFPRPPQNARTFVLGSLNNREGHVCADPSDPLSTFLRGNSRAMAASSGPGSCFFEPSKCCRRMPLSFPFPLDTTTVGSSAELLTTGTPFSWARKDVSQTQAFLWGHPVHT